MLTTVAPIECLMWSVWRENRSFESLTPEQSLIILSLPSLFFLKDCIFLFKEYQTSFHKTREKILESSGEKSFEVSEMYIFGKFEAFCKRLEKVSIMQSLYSPPTIPSGYFVFYIRPLRIIVPDLSSHCWYVSSSITHRSLHFIIT